MQVDKPVVYMASGATLGRNDTASRLQYDVLLTILRHFFDTDYGTLYRCALVSWGFNAVATKLLYAQVVLSPPYQAALDLRDPEGLGNALLFTSSLLPRNVNHVLSLSIGPLYPRPTALPRLAKRLVDAVTSFRNLYSLTIATQPHHGDMLNDFLRALGSCENLRMLDVNASCADEPRAPILIEVRNLVKLTLRDPPRAMLQLLPQWLGQLSHMLRQLHLTGNCGSITPGVLRSLTPHVASIKSLSLGLSYSLTDENVFSFLAELPHLESVQLQYYLQFRTLAVIRTLPRLRSFTVRHARPQGTAEAQHLAKWVRRAIAHAPIEHLRLVCSDDDTSSGPRVKIDGLVDHIVARHHATLRTLDLAGAFIGASALRRLCVVCGALEDLTIVSGPESLAVFADTAGWDLKVPKLRRLALEVSNIKRHKINVTLEDATQLMQRLPSLRCVSVNGTKWEGAWETTERKEVTFVVREVQTQKIPWEKNS